MNVDLLFAPFGRKTVLIENGMFALLKLWTGAWDKFL
jgi:hypothetical protein